MALALRSKGSAVRSVQEMLNLLGFRFKYKAEDVSPQFRRLAEDGIFGKEMESVVIDFQQSEGLLRDGIIGPITMRALETAYSRRVLELNSPGVDSTSGMPDRYVFERVSADQYKGDGYKRLSLRNDVANAYMEVYDFIHKKGGILTSSGGIRGLNETVNASRSATSFHYVGLALDLFIYSGMVDAKIDPFVISREAERDYRIFARCSKDNNPQAELPEPGIIEHAITYDNRIKGIRVEGTFVDLTALFEEHGFKKIRPRRLFEEGDSMMGAEWWHFQYEKGLVKCVTTFGSELLKVYSRQTLEDTPPWKYRDYIFGINWN